MRCLAVGDEVLVHNPETMTFGREKITRIHDHGKDKREHNNKFVHATEITIRVSADVKVIKHVLASSHYVLTKRCEGSTFEMRRADETEIGDYVLINDGSTTSGEGIVIGTTCYKVPSD